MTEILTSLACPDCGADCIPGSMHQCPYRGLVQVPLHTRPSPPDAGAVPEDVRVAVDVVRRRLQDRTIHGASHRKVDAALAWYVDHSTRLQGELEQANKQVSAMQPVIDAAIEYLYVRENAYEQWARDASAEALEKAVSAYRNSQSPPPEGSQG